LYGNVDDIELTSDKALIISPDEGGMQRCLRYSAFLGLNIGMFYKRRDYSKVVNGRNPIISHDFLGSEQDVVGKDVIIIDDILASGESILQVAKKLNDMGAKRIFTFITFGEFSSGTDLFDKAYEDGVIDKIFVTNTTYKDEKIINRPWFCNVDVSKYLAKVINSLNCNQSISELLTPTDKIQNVKERVNELKIQN
jgi:ribose-phosphate pyrophosphokinase